MPNDDPGGVKFVQPVTLAVLHRDTLGDAYAGVCSQFYLDPSPEGYSLVMGVRDGGGEITLLAFDAQAARELMPPDGTPDTPVTILRPGTWPLAADAWRPLPAPAIIGEFPDPRRDPLAEWEDPTAPDPTMAAGTAVTASRLLIAGWRDTSYEPSVPVRVDIPAGTPGRITSIRPFKTRFPYLVAFHGRDCEVGAGDPDVSELIG